MLRFVAAIAGPERMRTERRDLGISVLFPGEGRCSPVENPRAKRYAGPTGVSFSRIRPPNFPFDWKCATSAAHRSSPFLERSGICVRGTGGSHRDRGILKG